MSNKVTYTNAPADVARSLSDASPMEDFLPSPDELVLKSEKERITIAIDRHSLELFRSYAKEHNAKYQTIINGVLGSYADKFLSHRP